MFNAYADGECFYSPRLTDEGYVITEPKCTVELNKAGSFTFDMPLTSQFYYRIQKMKTIITIKDDDEIVWKGRVLNDERNFYGTKSVVCEGELAFLNDIQYPPHDYSKNGIKMGEYFKKLIEYYASECTASRRIKLGTVKGAFSDVLIYPSTTEYTNIWNLVSGNIIGASDGKVGKKEVDLSEYDRYLYVYHSDSVSYVDLLEDLSEMYGLRTQQTIEFGKNLLDLSEYIDASNVYTHIIPLGKMQSNNKRVDIKIATGGNNYLRSEVGESLFGKIQKVVIWEDETSPSELLKKGQAKLDKAIKMATTITIRAFDLHLIDVNTDKIQIGDTVQVVSAPHGIRDAFLCTKISYDFQNPENTEYTFGLDFETLTGGYASYRQIADFRMESAMDQSAEINENLTAAINSLGDLQTQVDGNICSWFYPGTPSSTNYPASEWTTDTLKQQHSGDLYYDKETGIGYRWTGSAWDLIRDTGVAQALQNASTAQSTADGKVRCFTVTPYPPYETGDLWAGGSSGDLKTCVYSRRAGESYVSTDWAKASKYTDDTLANTANNNASNAAKTATDYIYNDGNGNVRYGTNGSRCMTATNNGIQFAGVRNQTSLYDFGNGSSYASQFLSIDLSSYSAVLITFESKKGSTWFAGGGGAGATSMVVPVNGVTYSMVYPWNTVHRRDITVYQNGIQFGTGKERTSNYGIVSVGVLASGGNFDLQSPGSDGWDDNNSVCMPRQLFGFL